MKTIILDFDGTIADTRNSIVECVRQTLETMHLPQADEQEIAKLIGLPLRDTFATAANINDEETINTAIATYRRLYNDICLSTVTLFPHVKETLQALHQQGLTIAVASNKGKEALERLLKQLEISAYISLIFGEQDVKNKKPAPDMALLIMSATNSRGCETLVVGDTIYDIQMGQSAGCLTCGVTYGNHTARLLREQGADFLIDDFSSIKNICS